MGSFVMMLQEWPVYWYHEYEKTLITVFLGHPVVIIPFFPSPVLSCGTGVVVEIVMWSE